MADMRVLVCGSRKWKNINRIGVRLALLPPGTTIVHGGAGGADSIAGAWAKEVGWPVEVYLPNWSLDGNSAGKIRNIIMLNTHPDLVIAFWDGESRGTMHTVDGAKKRGIPFEVITYSSTWDKEHLDA